MASIIRADIDPSILTWARELIRMSVPVAAKKIGVNPGRLEAWESGTVLPTIQQLRKAARVYGQSFAVFFLPAPPAEKMPDVPDCRRSPGTVRGKLTSDLALDLRTSAERRESYLELISAAGEEPGTFPLAASLTEEPELVAERMRVSLGITLSEQRAWRESRLSFNAWREAIESLSVLVFQTKTVSASEMRGYSLDSFPSPVIVVNRKDEYARRSFTLHHELCHLALRSSGLCDLVTDLERPPEDQRLEVFCNHVAGAVLVPRTSILAEPLVSGSSTDEWSDLELRQLAYNYSVSKEVVLRRLLILGKTTVDVYRAYRDRAGKGKTKKPRKGFVLPPTDSVSLAGRPFVARVLAELGSGRISASDTSDLLGVRLKHIAAISSLVEA